MWKRLIRPLQSRKVRVALVTVIAAYLADWGLGVDPEIILTVLGVGVSLILGIAHEDAGAKSNANVLPNGLRDERGVIGKDV